jgi:hypothetical protein
VKPIDKRKAEKTPLTSRTAFKTPPSKCLAVKNSNLAMCYEAGCNCGLPKGNR